MSLTLTLTGTGGAQGVPAWGCECAACARARRSPQYRRQPCSGVVKFNDAITLIDAGLHDLADRWSPGSFQQFLLTHYHMDHVQGLFPLRWGVGDPIPVYGPPDEQGCDDLFKHPGLTPAFLNGSLSSRPAGPSMTQTPNTSPTSRAVSW